MRPTIVIFACFVLIGLGLAGYTLYQANIVDKQPAGAGGFGISPPFVRAGTLKPGETYKKTITIQRSDSEEPQAILISVDAPLISDWIAILPTSKPLFAVGRTQVKVTVGLTVPDDAYNGSYEGYIYISLPGTVGSGVGIGLGARVDVAVTVAGGRDRAGAIAPKVDQDFVRLSSGNLVRRLRGRIILRVYNHGEIWYINGDNTYAYFLPVTASGPEIVRMIATSTIRSFLDKIPIATGRGESPDSDRDGLSDRLELAIGTDPADADSDNDGFGDYDEVAAGYSPLRTGQSLLSINGYEEILGMFVSTEPGNTVWYIDPESRRRYLVDRPEDILYLAKQSALGINEDNWRNMLVE